MNRRRHAVSGKCAQICEALYRIDRLTANLLENEPLSKRIADLGGLSLQMAEKVVAGLAPFPLKSLVAVAQKLGVTTDCLLMGKRPSEPEAKSVQPLDEEEKELLKHYESADAGGRARITFIITLPQLLESMPEEASSRVVASMVHLHDAGLQELLAFLPATLGAYKVKTGVDPMDWIESPHIITPLHEWLGVFGPEQKPLLQYLVTR